MRLRIFLPAIFLLVLAGCSNGLEEGKSTAPATTAPAIPSNTVTIQPVQQQQTAPATGQVALNPAHGMPGHRCDIKVGEPLNSAPAQSATTVNPQPTMIAPTAPPSGAATTKAGMNPAHGQPGHRCDIAVGAPLNSKPAQ